MFNPVFLEVARPSYAMLVYFAFKFSNLVQKY